MRFEGIIFNLLLVRLEIYDEWWDLMGGRTENASCLKILFIILTFCSIRENVGNKKNRQLKLKK